MARNDEESYPLLGSGYSAKDNDRSGFGKLYKERRDPSKEKPEPSYALQSEPAFGGHVLAHSRAPSALKLQVGKERSASAPPREIKLPHPKPKWEAEKLKSPRARNFGAYRLSGKKRFCLGDIRSTDIHYEQCGEAPMPEMIEASSGFLSVAHLRDDAYWREIMGEDLQTGGPYLWIESNLSHLVVVMCICSNACVLGLPDISSSVFWLEQVVLAISVAELFFVVARRTSGIPFKTPTDAKCVYLDTIVVAVCTCEKWVVPLFASLHHAERNSVLRTLLRMIWLFRFVRLIRIVPALNELARGVLDAVQGLFWVLCFMLLLIYAIAILVTRLIGHFEAETMRDPHQIAEVKEVQKMFRDVKTSMFYLFETMSSWTLVPLFSLFRISPITRLLFVVFYIYAGWTLLAVMTGVVSFNMIALRAQITREDEARDQAAKSKAKETLMEIFEFADYDRSGELNVEEFDHLMVNEEIVKQIEANTNIKKQDLEDLWHWLDDDNSESISWEEFLRGFQWLNEPFKPKTLLRLQEKITKEMKVIKRSFLDLVRSTWDSIVLHVQPPMLKMHAITEQVQLLGVSVETLQRSIHMAAADAEANKQMKATDSVNLAPQDYTLADFEDNFTSQIDLVLARLDRFRPAHSHALQHFANEGTASPTSPTRGSMVQRERDPLLFNQAIEHVEHVEQDADETHSQHTDTQHYEPHDTPGYSGQPVRASQTDCELLRQLS